MTSISANNLTSSGSPPDSKSVSLGNWLLLNWEPILYGLIFVLAVTTRFYDLGARAISHDESLHMLYSFKLFDGDGYRHDPMMHGPFLFELTAFLFLLFGDSNFVGRVGVALFGVALVMMPYWFRPWLGRVGALAASALILISPAVMHYSRHLRHDIFNEFFTILMFIALFQYLLAWQKKDESGKTRWLIIGAAAVAFSLATKELAFIHGFIGVTFIVIISLMERTIIQLRRRLFWLGLVLLLGVGAVVLWLTITNAGPLPPTAVPGLGRQVVDTIAGLVSSLSSNPETMHDAHVKSVWKLIQLLVLVTGLFFAATTLGLSVTDKAQSPTNKPSSNSGLRLNQVLREIPLRQLGTAVVMAIVIFAVLYTTFFTNPYGAVSGTWGALSYWLSQQDVQRGSQPWYYYLMLLPLYEFLPLVLGTAGGIWYLIRRLRLSRPGQSDSQAKDQDGGTSSRVANSTLDRYFVALLIYWTIDNIFIYSWAGEKMPWLLVHLTIPLIFLAAWTIDRVTRGIDWRALWDRGGALFAILLLLTLAAIVALLRVRPFQGQSLFDLRDTGQWVGALLITVLLAYGVVRYGKQLGRRLAGKTAFMVIVILLSLLTFRSAWLVSFVNYDNVSEYLFYAHGAPDVTLAMNQIQDMSRRTVGDKSIKVAYDNDSTWPLEWYFREYPNRAYYGDSPSREQLDAPIVIVGATNESKVTPFLGDEYHRFNYRLVWWPLESYKDQTPGSLFDTYVIPDLVDGANPNPEAARAGIQQNWEELWDVLFYHQHQTPKNDWPYVHRFYMYVRKDVLNELWDYQIGAPITQEVTDPYTQGHLEFHAVKAVGNQGTGSGQLTTPRAVAAGPDGLWYVADSGNNRIQVFDQDGNFVRSWGSPGTAIGQFQEPWGIAVSDDGRVYVADTWNHRIQVFDLDGQYLFQWGFFADVQGRYQEQPGAFWGPRDISLDGEGNVFVADTGNKRVQKFTHGGEYISLWGGGGVIPGSFEEPTSLDFGPDGNIFVADTWNRRIQVFSPDLTPISQWPIDAWESESVVNKPFLRVNDQGNVYVSDPENYRILVFDEQGNFLNSFGQYGFDMASFALPLGLDFDAGQNLLVIDSDNNRLLQFPPLDPGHSAQ